MRRTQKTRRRRRRTAETQTWTTGSLTPLGPSTRTTCVRRAASRERVWAQGGLAPAGAPGADAAPGLGVALTPSSGSL